MNQQVRTIISATSTHKEGLIKTLVLMVVGIVVLSIIGFDIRAAVENEQTQANFKYVITIGQGLYDKYLADIGAGLWRIFEPFLSTVYNALVNWDWQNINANIPAAPDIDL